MTYKFTYRRRFFWRTLAVIGHRHEPSCDKMVVFFADGSCREIKYWHRHEMKLDVDWVLAEKKHKEAEIGTSIPLRVDAKTER